MVKAAQTAIKQRVSNKPINQEAAFTEQETKLFLAHLVDMPGSADIASMLLHCGIATQSLSMPGRLCDVKRKEISMYPNQEMHETADFGPIMMLGVSTVGFKQNEQAQVIQWIQRKAATAAKASVCHGNESSARQQAELERNVCGFARQHVSQPQASDSARVPGWHKCLVCSIEEEPESPVEASFMLYN